MRRLYIVQSLVAMALYGGCGYAWRYGHSRFPLARAIDCLQVMTRAALYTSIKTNRVTESATILHVILVIDGPK
jgi:hypothetical protein